MEVDPPWVHSPGAEGAVQACRSRNYFTMPVAHTIAVETCKRSSSTSKIPKDEEALPQGGRPERPGLLFLN